MKFELRSNLLRACFYQPATRMMALQMRTGGWRFYDNISDAIVRELVCHPTPGSFYNLVLRVGLGAPLPPLSLKARLFYHRLRKMK